MKMVMHFIVVFLMLFLVAPSVALSADVDPKYDTLFLVLQVTTPVGTDEAYWTVQGLWAELAVADAPGVQMYTYLPHDDCVGVEIKYNYTAMDPNLKNELYQMWPSRRDIGGFSTEGLWAHEIEKHARCMKDIVQNGEDYLKLGYDLWNDSNIKEIMGTGGEIGPLQQVDSGSLRDLFRRRRGFDVTLECEGHFLVRIIACYKKFGIRTDCLPTHPDPTKDCPAGHIQFLPEYWVAPPPLYI